MSCLGIDFPLAQALRNDDTERSANDFCRRNTDDARHPRFSKADGSVAVRIDHGIGNLLDNRSAKLCDITPDEKVLEIASSDMIYFLRNRQIFVGFILAYAPKRVADDCRNSAATACGLYLSSQR